MYVLFFVIQLLLQVLPPKGVTIDLCKQCFFLLLLLALLNQNFLGRCIIILQGCVTLKIRSVKLDLQKVCKIDLLKMSIMYRFKIP